MRDRLLASPKVKELEKRIRIARNIAMGYNLDCIQYSLREQSRLRYLFKLLLVAGLCFSVWTSVDMVNQGLSIHEG